MAGRLVGRARAARARRRGRARRDRRQARRSRRDHRRDATSSGSSPTSASSARPGSPSRSTSRTRRTSVSTSSRTRARGSSSATPPSRSRRCATVRGKLPALEGIIRATGAAADRFERTLADLERQGAEWRKREPRRARGPARGHRPGRARELHLHLRHDRQPEGRHPHPRQLGLRGGSGRAAPDHRAGRPPPHVPADGPLVREGHRGGLVRHRREASRSSSRSRRSSTTPPR